MGSKSSQLSDTHTQKTKQKQRTSCLQLSRKTLSLKRRRFLPTQHTQNQVKNEKGAEDHKTDKVDPWKLKAHSIIHLAEQEVRGEEKVEKKRQKQKKMSFKRQTWTENKFLKMHLAFSFIWTHEETS